MEFRIGCSGWSYRHWRGDFYPKGLPQREWLEHYASVFDTVEINSTFYRLQRPSTVERWRERVPGGFRFAVKVSRYVTHVRRLQDGLDRFFDNIGPLGDRVGPLLYQLPPNFERDGERLDQFLRRLPADHVHAFEFRHPSWWVDPVFDLLREHRAAFVMYDQAGTATPFVCTAADAYIRCHGPEARYQGGYSRQHLATLAGKLRELPAKRTWAYFNNDIGGHAPRDALQLRELVEGGNGRHQPGG